jgi:myo-inositol-1-phosphate synthase
LFKKRPVKLERTYQLNTGGNTCLSDYVPWQTEHIYDNRYKHTSNVTGA